MTRFFALTVFVLSLITGAQAQAATILIPDNSAGGIIGNIAFIFADPANPVFDITGVAPATIVDSSTAAIVGNGLVLDVDPSTPDVLVLTNLGFTDLLAFDFDFASSVIASGTWTLPVTGSPLTPLTDPAIAGFVGNNLAQFSLLGTTPIGEQLGVLATYRLDFILGPERVTPIPEPATLTLLGTGLFAVARRRMKRNRS